MQSPGTKSRDTKRHISSNDDNMARTIIDNHLLYALAILEKWVTTADTDQQIPLVFGRWVDIGQAKRMLQNLCRPASPLLPRFEICSGSVLNGASGAFAGANYTIYLSRELLMGNQDNPEAVIAVILEELGHAIDWKLNAVDAPGDEGEMFANLVQGHEIGPADLKRITAENDRSWVTIESQQLEVEQAITDPVDYHNPGLPQDLTSLSAFIYDRQLVIDFTVTTPFTVGNIEFFLDTDQNQLTGDIRTGYLGGAEYRISAVFNGFLIRDYQLWRLPRSLQELNAVNPEISVFGNPVPIQASTFGSFRLILPLAAIGNPNNIDVIALAHRNLADNVRAIGDRLPNYGVVSTTNQQQPIIRRNNEYSTVTVRDAFGDNTGLAPDLIATSFMTQGDQFQITLFFAQQIDPQVIGIAGAITLDTDRSILTGDIPMGGAIGTWGGDILLTFNFKAGASVIQIQDNSGGAALFGPPQNDGRWRIQGNALILEGSLSLFDAYSIKSTAGQTQYTRIPANGRMYAQVNSVYATQNGFQYDLLTPNSSAVDTKTGEVFESLKWDPSKTVSVTDPVEFGFLSGTDLTQVDAQIVNDSLIVKGFLTSWTPSDLDNLFEIHLDTDMDSTTGFNGADYKVLAYSTSSVNIPIYGLSLEKYTRDGQLQETSVHASLLTYKHGTPGSFTVNLPLQLLGNLGAQLRLIAFTYKHDGAVAGGGGAWIGKELGSFNLSVFKTPFDSSPALYIGLSGSASTTTFAISPGAARQFEGNRGTKPFTFLVTRSGDLGRLNTIDWALIGSSANPAMPSDTGGTIPSGTLVFNPGESVKSIIVNVSGDTQTEPDESFSVALSNASNGAIISTAIATGTILNDDLAINNDNFLNRILLVGQNLSTTGTNIGFSGEWGEPEQRGDIRSAWWSWTAPQSSLVTIDTNQSSFDTYLSVFTGNSVGALVVVAQDDDGGSEPTTASRVSFPAIEGTTYQIAVDGYGNESGNITLNINQTPSTVSSFSIVATNASRMEGNGERTSFTFTINRSGNLTTAAEVSVLVSGTGSNPAVINDFGGGQNIRFPSQIVSFNPNQTSAEVSIDVWGDASFETDETFLVTLTSPNDGTTIGTATAMGTILNDDASNRSPTDLEISRDTVAENSAPNTRIGLFSAFDPDLNESFTFTFVTGTGSTDNALFAIEDNQLKAKETFDFESKRNYTIRVRVTDKDGLFFEKALSISVTDVNENRSGQIRGLKWNDLNGNGIRETSESGLSGMRIFLDANKNGIFDQGEVSTTTNASGQYAFTKLTPATYLVGEVLPAGWQQTWPNTGQKPSFRLLSSTSYEGANANSLVELQFNPVSETVVRSPFYSIGLDVNPLNKDIYAGTISLHRIGTIDGSYTRIGAINSVNGVVYIKSLTFSPDGKLYVFSVDYKLYTINEATAYATEIGSVSSDLECIDFAPDGTLYAASSSLYKLDKATGKVLETIGVIGPTIADIDYAPDGYLYGSDRSTQSLYRISPVNASSTLLGKYTSKIVGVASAPSGEDVPSTFHNIPLQADEVVADINFGNRKNTPTDGDDALIGTAAGDVIDGLAGDDSIAGGAGNDRLTGNVGNDVLAGGLGRDRVFESRNADFTLTNTSLSGNGNDKLRSIELVTLNGGPGPNALNASAFTLGGVTLNGGAGNDMLQGGTSSDRLTGGSGDDTLIGGAKNDTLTGGSGADRFTFNTTTEGIDSITDFRSSHGDKIAISASRFGGGLNAGTLLTAGQFIQGSASVSASNRLIFNPANKKLSFDPDGTGALEAIPLATVNNASLVANDILVIV
ncbi:MAG: SdrD B-like domain-containing protein [Cyanobacteriota bacterium]|nr:SdrD B-like domain-containing protein [Cyanobacteriota bacterium]